MRFALLLCVLAMGCPSSTTNTDGGSTDSGGLDSSAVDSGGVDVGTQDAGGEDAAEGDAGESDAGANDGGPGFDTGGEIDAGVDGGPAICSVDMPCEGACTGRSCGADWFCVTDIPCTDDIATFCGCDGTTFTGSSTCPSRPFASMGPCPPRDGLRCDRRSVSCRAPEPMCEFGFVPEVDESGSCWTFRCVPIGECGCDEPAQCSDPDMYTCRRDMGRCTPFL